MKANYNVTGNDRKALAAAIENLTGDKDDLHAYADLRLRDRRHHGRQRRRRNLRGRRQAGTHHPQPDRGWPSHRRIPKSRKRR